MPHNPGGMKRDSTRAHQITQNRTQGKIHELLNSGIFHVIFSESTWLWVTGTPDKEGRLYTARRLSNTLCYNTPYQVLRERSPAPWAGVECFHLIMFKGHKACLWGKKSGHWVSWAGVKQGWSQGASPSYWLHSISWPGSINFHSKYQMATDVGNVHNRNVSSHSLDA